MSKKILLILIVIVLLGGGAAAWFLILKPSQETGDEPELYEYAIKDSFVTNVKDSSKLFKATIVLVASEKGLDEYIEENQYVIRDTTLFVLRGLTETDIKSDDIQDRLRVSIPQAINQALGAESIVSVRFTDFVMQ